MQVAYHVQAFQIIGAPEWIDSERYDIEGKAESDLRTDQKAAPLLQALIEERFKAVTHGETRDLPVYFLTSAKNGRHSADTWESAAAAPWTQARRCRT